MHFLTYIAGRLNDSILQPVATPPSGQVEGSADDSPTSLPISDAPTARAATRASAVAGNFNQRATPPNTSQRDARAANRHLAGIDEHCATSLLSLSFFQVHRFFQHPRQQALLLKSRALLLRRLPHCTHWLVSMSIVLCHFSHFHSFRFTGSSSIPGNKRHCCKAGLCSCSASRIVSGEQLQKTCYVTHYISR